MAKMMISSPEKVVKAVEIPKKFDPLFDAFLDARANLAKEREKHAADAKAVLENAVSK